MTDTVVQVEEAVSAEETTTSTPQVVLPKARRGFALLSPERRAEIASKGGKQSQKLGTAHKFTSEEAREAGKKGGAAPHVRRGKQAKKTNVETPNTESTFSVPANETIN